MSENGSNTRCEFYDAVLGAHVFLSFLRYLANNKASSLTKVSIVCLSSTFILGIQGLPSYGRFQYSRVPSHIPNFFNNVRLINNVCVDNYY